MLRPGLHILRRDLRTFQIGLEWPGIAVLQDSESVRAVLDAVDGFRDVTGVVLAATARGVTAQRAERALQVLVDAGVLVDQTPCVTDHLDESGWAALWLLAGPDGSADALLTTRARTRVQVEGTGRVARLVRSLIRQEQVPLTSDPHEANLRVLSSEREPSRARSDDAMRLGVPYLCIGVRELVGIVGPFVVPGRTACQRCVDLSRAQVDRCWPTLVDSAGARPAKVAPCSASLAAVIAGYAAQEVALWASGHLPVSCDHVVEIPHGLGTVQTVAYPPHPECGCGWVAQHDTMSA